MSKQKQLERIQDIVRELIPGAMCRLAQGETQVVCYSGPDRSAEVRFELNGLAIGLIRRQAELLATKIAIEDARKPRF